MLDRTRRTVTDDHVVVALLANHEPTRKGHGGAKCVLIWGGASSQLRAARRIGRPATPQRTPPGGMH